MAVQKTRRAPTLRTNVLLLILLRLRRRRDPGLLGLHHARQCDGRAARHAVRRKADPVRSLARHGRADAGSGAGRDADPLADHRRLGAATRPIRTSRRAPSPSSSNTGSRSPTTPTSSSSTARATTTTTTRRTRMPASSSASPCIAITRAMPGTTRRRSLAPGCHLNVDHDDELDVTKVWINCVVTRRREGAGRARHRLDLTAFIRRWSISRKRACRRCSSISRAPSRRTATRASSTSTR